MKRSHTTIKAKPLRLACEAFIIEAEDEVERQIEEVTARLVGTRLFLWQPKLTQEQARAEALSRRHFFDSMDPLSIQKVQRLLSLARIAEIGNKSICLSDEAAHILSKHLIAQMDLA